MRAYRTDQIVPDSHLLTVQLPPGTPTGPAQVIVLFPDESSATVPNADGSSSGFANVAAFAQWLQTQPATARSTADIEQQIADERAAWD